MALLTEFENLIMKENKQKNHDNILDGLKIAIKDRALHLHKWDEKALESLVITLSSIQLASKAVYLICKKNLSELFNTTLWKIDPYLINTHGIRRLRS